MVNKFKKYDNFSKYLSQDINAILAFNEKKKSTMKVAKELNYNYDNLAIPEQIHSSKVLYIDKPGIYKSIDGLITNNFNLTLTLKVADCVPIYFYDKKSKIIGLIHSGWRGTVYGIIENTIEVMNSSGVCLESLKVFLGPAIGICCYNVSNDVAVLFNNNSKKKIEDNKWKVSLHREILYQLHSIGISFENVYCSKICTYENLIYHSFRRENVKSGRMIAFLNQTDDIS